MPGNLWRFWLHGCNSWLILLLLTAIQSNRKQDILQIFKYACLILGYISQYLLLGIEEKELKHKLTNCWSYIMIIHPDWKKPFILLTFPLFFVFRKLNYQGRMKFRKEPWHFHRLFFICHIWHKNWY